MTTTESTRPTGFEMESGARTGLILRHGEFMPRRTIETILGWPAAKHVRGALT